MRRALLMIAFLLASRPLISSANPPFYVKQVIDVCQLPRPGATGRVVGHDNGSSVRVGTNSYWFFADTALDAVAAPSNQPGGLDKADVTGITGIYQGTGAITTSTNAANCIDMTDYNENTSGIATSVFAKSDLKVDPANPANDEKLIWPQGAIAIGNSIYLFADSVRGDKTIRETFLSSFSTTSRTATRFTNFYWSDPEPSFSSPMTTIATHNSIQYVYVLGSRLKASGVQEFHLARIPADRIVYKGEYTYWNGASFDPDVTHSRPIFQEYGADSGSLFFNSTYNRYMIVYTCTFSTEVCMRVSTALGDSETTITQWPSLHMPPTPDDRIVLFECPGGNNAAGQGGKPFRCYAAFVHKELGAGKKVLISTARNSPTADDCTSTACRCGESCDATKETCIIPDRIAPRYGITLRMVELTPSARARKWTNATGGFGYTPVDDCDTGTQGQNGWSYKQWNSTTGFNDLTFSNLFNWKGTETISGFPVPTISEDALVPGNTHSAVRVWAPPVMSPSASARVRVTGEVRKQFSCGDSVTADVILIRNGTISGLPLASASLSATPTSKRAQRIRLAVTLHQGDSLGFRVTHGGLNAACDDVLFAPGISYQMQ